MPLQPLIHERSAVGHGIHAEVETHSQCLKRCKTTSYKISLANTPASDAYLRISLEPKEGKWTYHINALWMPKASPDLTMTCGSFSYNPGYSPAGAINSGPVDPKATDMQQLNGSYKNSNSRMTYTWVLGGGA